MLKIGNFDIENRLIMAPMSGKTNLPFRLIVKKMGAGLVMTEMISAVGLVRGQPKTHAYLASHPAERPVASQLFGCEPDSLAESARIATERGMDMVDINVGCPAKKVVRSGSGAALMRDPEKIAKIVAAVRKSTDIPVTVKIRAGWSPQEANAVEVARIAEDNGADGVSVHPRFATQGFSGAADWSVIERIKKVVTIPVIGSGDVTEPYMAKEMRAVTGCDGVMIGRAAVVNPWIFRQILDWEKTGDFKPPDLEERYRLVMEHY